MRDLERDNLVEIESACPNSYACVFIIFGRFVRLSVGVCSRLISRKTVRISN